MENNTRNFTLTITPSYTEIICTDKEGCGSFHVHGLLIEDILESIAFGVLDAFEGNEEFKKANPTLNKDEYFNWIESED